MKLEINERWLRSAPDKNIELNTSERDRLPVNRKIANENFINERILLALLSEWLFIKYIDCSVYHIFILNKKRIWVRRNKRSQTLNQKINNKIMKISLNSKIKSRRLNQKRSQLKNKLNQRKAPKKNLHLKQLKNKKNQQNQNLRKNPQKQN